MTEAKMIELMQKCSESFSDLYGSFSIKIPKQLILAAMAGALAACATEAGADREKVIDALNSAFDDIEEGVDDQET